MIILRNKIFAEPQALTPDSNEQQNSQELLIEQMRMQRALLQNQRQRQKIQAQESRDRIKRTQDAQKLEQRRDEQEQKNQIRVKRLEMDRDEAKNVGLYKTKSHPVPPVPMKV